MPQLFSNVVSKRKKRFNIEQDLASRAPDAHYDYVRRLEQKHECSVCKTPFSKFRPSNDTEWPWRIARKSPVLDRLTRSGLATVSSN